MNTRKWTISLLIILLGTLFVFGLFMYSLDPLLQYGKESFPLTYYAYSEMYSNPGLAKNYEYDTVLVGTSMIQNTDIDEFDEAMGTDALRLPYSGGTAHNMKIILDVCFNSRNKMKTVYWELDEYQLFSNPDETRYPLPDYLYRNDHIEDLSYLLNLDIMYHYGIKDLLLTLRGQKQAAERRGDTFAGKYGKEAVLKSYKRPAETTTDIKTADILLNKVKLNLTQNIEPLITGNPDTEFIFYFVPFSILYWDRELRNGRFDLNIETLKYTVGKLLVHKNVKIYFFHNEESIITELDNYKDYSHYGKWINSYMTRAMAADQNRLTEDNYQEAIDKFRIFVQTYDFESAFK